MPFAAINGQKLFYTDSGGEGKPVLVFSHGLLMDHSMFDPQVAALKDSYRCIAWDERAKAMVQTLPQSQWVEIAGAGHAPNLTHPAPVNQAMTQFLSTLA